MYARNKLDEEGALRTELLSGSDCNPSAEYEEFLRSIGWLVDIATHPGYLADADPTMVRLLFPCTHHLQEEGFMRLPCSFSPLLVGSDGRQPAVLQRCA
jgi:hypothetical protein